MKIKTIRSFSKSDVPHLSHSEIEDKVHGVLEYFQRGLLITAQPTPLEDFLSMLSTKYGVYYDLEADLSSIFKKRKVLGCFVVRPRAILIDKSIRSTPQFPFTVAHEIGHLVLHRKLKISASDYAITDSLKDIATGRKLLSSPRDWLEWQANRFATAFLMPRASLVRELARFQKEDLGLRRNIGSVYLDNQTCNQVAFAQTLDHIAKIFHTSKESTENRMRDLSLLLDVRDSDSKHVAAWLRED